VEESSSEEELEKGNRSEGFIPDDDRKNGGKSAREGEEVKGEGKVGKGRQ